MAQKRPFNEGKGRFKKNKKQKQTPGVSDGSNEEVLLKDVRKLLREARISRKDANTAAAPERTQENGLEEGEVELEISELSSTGDGLACKDDKVYVVPTTAPGDTVVGRVNKTMTATMESSGQEREQDGDGEDKDTAATYVLADFVRVVKPSPLRTEHPPCPYFTQCGGCSFQHLSYDTQLAHKKRIVEKAYENFSNLGPAAVPAVGETIGSPLQYGYRTKLTPHFDRPPGGRRDRRHGVKVEWPGVPPIGFMLRGTRRTMDIEDCPIGTKVVRLGMKRERERVSREITKYVRGATLLLRESTERIQKEEGSGGEVEGAQAKEEIREEGGSEIVDEDRGDVIHRKACITDQKGVSTEYVDGFRFDNPANAFFQNNNSILPLVTQYIRDHIMSPPPASSSSTDSTPSTAMTQQPAPKIKNLIDAYCGSGFFTITLSSLFDKAIGIDISGQSIASAETNARLNKLPKDSTKFIAADANDLFASLKSSSTSPATTTDSSNGSPAEQNFKPEETVVIIDPPRKGCDEDFLRQLLAFAPARVCYVSCNVHTQARDVGMLVEGFQSEQEGGKGVKGLYEIESLRGFDFFPQTGHVEGVAMLRKKEVS